MWKPASLDASDEAVNLFCGLREEVLVIHCIHRDFSLTSNPLKNNQLIQMNWKIVHSGYCIKLMWFLSGS